MAYEVTATRRRPQRFEDLVGQEFVASTLKNSIESKKIAHAYLFSGPRGCGKTSSARILAKALNCKKGPASTPCGECEACREITAGSCLDVIEIDGASNNGVEAARQIKDEVLFPPNSCRYKIYIIDEVHMLSTSAFNALLKTIEEPPPYAVFIFATTELHKVPITIKSRCQQFNFRLVPVEKIKEQLALAAQELGIKAEDEALYWIAREATGSMRDSYTLFDQVAAFSDGEITYNKIRDKLGLVGVDRLNELFSLCVSGNSKEAISKLDLYLQNGISIEQFISNCADYLRSLLLIKSGIDREALLGQSPERYSKEVLAAWNNTQIERALDLMLQLYRDIRYSLSPRYEMELAISRLCWLKEYVSPSEVKKALDLLRPLLAGRASSATVSYGNSTEQRNEESKTASSDEKTERFSSKPLPEGMPVFDALKNFSEDEKGKSEVKPPFPDGGAVPPLEKTAGISETENEFKTEKSSSVSSSLPSSFSSDFKEADYEDSDSDEDSYDESDDGDEEYSAAPEGMTAPSDYNLPEEENKKTVKIQSFTARNVSSSSDISEVASAMAESFSLERDGLMAALVRKVCEWKKEGDVVRATVRNSFDADQLQLASSAITSYLNGVYQHPVKFAVVLEEVKKENKPLVLPDEVKILVEAFWGTVQGF